MEVIDAVQTCSEVDYSPELISLRSAARSDRWEGAVIETLEHLERFVREGKPVQIAWPEECEASLAAQTLSAPLAVAVLSAALHGNGRIGIHLRCGSVSDFLPLPVNPRVQFVFHINADQAAMRWERGEADPSLRIQAAARLKAAGWKVRVCVGSVRLFSGWRGEYGDLMKRLASAGLDSDTCVFAGESVLDGAASGFSADMDGLDAAQTASGIAFAVCDRRRAEFMRFFDSKRFPGNAISDPGSKSGMATSRHRSKTGGRAYQVRFGVRATRPTARGGARVRF